MALSRTGVDRFDGILRQADEQTNRQTNKRRTDKQTSDQTDERPNRRTTEQTNDTRAKMEVVDIGQRTE